MPTVLQLSDTHLLPSGEKLYGRDVNDNFLNVVAAARSSAPFDLVILTGDISEEGTKESYQRVVSMLASISYGQLIAIPGNHDVPDNVSAVMSMQSCTFGPWKVIPLNSHWDRHVEGKLKPEDLEQLEKDLLAMDNTSGFVMLAVHHPPHFPCTVAQCGLSNADALLELTERHAVRLVISGHVHDDYAHRSGCTLFSTCPSTCIGFDHNPAGHGASTLPPGAVIYDLKADGSVGRRAVYAEDRRHEHNIE